MNLFCLQLYTRAFIIKVFGLDDIAVCVALVCPTPFHWGRRQPVRTNGVNYQVITQSFNGLGVAIVYYGEGLHFNKVSPEDRAIWLKVGFSSSSVAEHAVDLGKSCTMWQCVSTSTPPYPSKSACCYSFDGYSSNVSLVLTSQDPDSRMTRR